MKQKLLGRISLYEDLDSNEIREAQNNLLDSWTKYSLIGLLITIFSKEKYFIDPFDAKIVTLLFSRDLCRSEENNSNKFVLNILVLLALLTFTYCLKGRTIVRKEEFDLTKVQNRTRRERNYTDVYKNYFRDFNIKFNTFLHKFFSFERLKKQQKICILDLNDSDPDPILRFRILSRKRDTNDLKHFLGFRSEARNNNWEHRYNSVPFDGFARNQEKRYGMSDIPPNTFLFPDDKLLFEADGSFESEREKYNPIFGSDLVPSKEFLNCYSLEETMSVTLWWEKEILLNLRNQGEADETLVRFSVSLNKNDSLLNHTEYLFRKLFGNYFDDSIGGLQHFFSGKTYNERFRFADRPNNIESLVNLENLSSDFIYRLSRYISHVYGNFNSGIDTDSNELYSGIDSIDPNLTHMYIEDEFWNLDEYDFGEIFKNTLFMGSVSVDRTFLPNQSAGTDSFGEAPAEKKRVMNNLFLRRNRISHFSELIYYVFLKLLSRDRSTIFFNKYSSIISAEGTNHSKDYVELDHTRDSWRIHKYYSNLSGDYSFPLNPVYTMIRQDNILDKDVLCIRGNKIPKIIHLLFPILTKSTKLKGFRIFTNCIGSERRLAESKNRLDISINESDKVENPHFRKVSLPSGPSSSYSSIDSNSNGRNESINNYLFIETKGIGYNFEFIADSIRINFLNSYSSMWSNCNKCFSKLLSNSDKKLSDYSGRDYTLEVITNGYLMAWKGIVRKSFIRNIEGATRNGMIFGSYKWFDKISNWGEKGSYLKIHASCNSWMESPTMSLFKFMNELSSSTQIFVNSNGIHFERNPLFDRSEKSINRDFVMSLRSNKSTHNSIIGSFINGCISSGNAPPFDLSLRNKELFPTRDYEKRISSFLNHSINFQSNNDEGFVPRLVSTRNCGSMDPQFLRIFTEYIIPVAQSSLLSVSSSGALHADFDKKELLTHVFGESTDRINSYLSAVSDAICPDKRMNQSKIAFDYQSFLIRKDDPFEGPEDSVVSASQLNDAESKTHFNALGFESLMKSKGKNNQIFQSINCIFPYPESEYFGLERSNRMKREKLGNTIELHTYNQYKEFNFFARYALFNNYTSWFFTSEWWEYHIHIFVEKFREVPSIINHHFEYLMDKSIRLMRQNLRKEIESHNLNSKWDSRLSVDYEEKKILDFSWSDFELINNWNGLHWAILTSVVSIFLFYRNSFPILIGLDPIDLWRNLETIKYLTDTSRAFYFTGLMHYSEARLSETENAIIHFFRNLPHYTRNIRFYLLTNKQLKEWLISSKGLDLSRRKRNLLTQSLITHTKLKRYGFQLYPKQKLLDNGFGYRVTHQQGLLYFRYLAKIVKKNLVSYPLHLAGKWIFSASSQRIIFSRTLWQAKKFDPRFHKIPTPLQFGLSRSKGILLIGPIETGRSYLIKNLAAESRVPLLKVSMNKLLYNKPDVITDNWMNILIESLRRLNLTLDLAKRMSPCIVWIQDIHQLDVNRLTQNVESDPTFLLGILSKHFQTSSIRARTNNNNNNIIMIGSTHVPRKVDPALISPNRLDRIINIRLFNNSQRRNQFPTLLSNKFRLKKNLSYFKEFESRTVGYNIRDLAAFTNEILLISITKNESLIRTDTMRFAFHRQVFGSTYKNDEPSLRQSFGTLLYKVGRAVAQNILVGSSVMNPLNTSNYLCKKKFYYLSKWYSESPTNESIMKESAILTHVLGCLAGIAARDSWFLSKKDPDASIPFDLDKLVENDFNLASSIFGSLFMEFPWLETCETRFINYRKERITTFPTRHFSNLTQSRMLAMGNESTINTQNPRYESSVPQRGKHPNGCESRNTAWSPRFWRLSFSRSQLFDWIKRPNDLEFSSDSGKDEHSFCARISGGQNDCGQLMGKKKEQLLYERILPRMRGRNVQGLESQFKEILLEDQSEILGFFLSSTEYRMEYQLDNELRLFIGKRILWDPIGLSFRMRYSVFPRRDLFMDEEMLRRLYVTYGARRERECSRPSHRMKQFFLCRGYNDDLISKLSVRWWNQSSMDGGQNIGTLKRIEKIGIQLKRPRIFTPVYLYQRWLIENLPEKIPRFELLTHRQRWLKVNNPLLNDSFVHTTLSESYQYLLRLFSSNRILLNRMMKILLEKKWLFQDDIKDLMIRNIK
uniref:hypothetical chloroplast RF21 n=1 Tax=Moerckia flotoviana TaxID=71401 RepID=UPI00257C589F|nr:hypothetical chloroplast RF21 [Moerckia flotoviana]WIA67289.1 hypothetical chloroplast RF21 [Moerckia flotoviana]